MEEKELVEVGKYGHWSDLFFNSDVPETRPMRGLKERAKEFLEEHPGCPYDVRWLVDNYRSRL